MFYKKQAIRSEVTKKNEELFTLYSDGIYYFNIDTSPCTYGNIELLTLYLDTSNISPEYSSVAEHNYCRNTAEIAKFLWSSNDDVVVFVCYVPHIVGELKGLTAKQWVKLVNDKIGKQFTINAISSETVTGYLQTNINKAIYSGKIKDAAIAHSFQILRSKKLLPDEEDNFTPEIAEIWS